MECNQLTLFTNHQADNAFSFSIVLDSNFKQYKPQKCIGNLYGERDFSLMQATLLDVKHARKTSRIFRMNIVPKDRWKWHNVSQRQSETTWKRCSNTVLKNKSGASLILFQNNRRNEYFVSLFLMFTSKGDFMVEKNAC